MIIETSRKNFSISSFNYCPETPTMFLHWFCLAQIVQTLCDSRARFFKKLHTGSQKFLSFFHQISIGSVEMLV